MNCTRSTCIALLGLLCLSGCAAKPLVCLPQERPQQLPAPPPLAFSQCLQLILAYGSNPDATYPVCSVTLRPPPTP